MLRVPSLKPTLCAALFVSGGLLLARSARADQTITLNTAAVVLHYNQGGSPSSHPNGSQPTWISHDDCTRNVYVAVPLKLAGTLQFPVQTWAGPSGADCTDPTQRSGLTQVCWQVAPSAQPQQVMTININSQDIVGPFNAPTGQKQPSGFTPLNDPAVCDSFTTSGAVPITLFFIAAQGTQNATGATNATYAISAALIGPGSPTNVGVEVGEKLLKVNWTPVLDPNTQGFRIFCDPPRGKEPTADSGTASGAIVDSGTEVVCRDGGTEDGGFDEAGTYLGDIDVDGGCETINVGSSGGGGTSGNCTSSEIISGGGTASTTGDDESGSTTVVTGATAPPSNINDYKCGEVASPTSTSYTVTDLQDGTKYVMGVAAYDIVGNLGPMSIPGCDTPTPVSDFWNVYKNAGGSGGGGFCSVDKNNEPAGLGAFAIVGGACAVSVFRRRRKNKNNKRSARR